MIEVKLKFGSKNPKIKLSVLKELILRFES